MAIVESTQKCETGNLGQTLGFSFSQNASKLFLMMSDYLYSDKEYCVISELSSNAVDAHQMVGKQDLPIQVDLPTNLESQFVVRDFGPGLSEEDVYRFLTQYGESSKQNSNDFIGSWGIGSKSPAAVTDNWTVKSYHDGTLKHYEIFINEQGIPTITKLFEGPTTETGLEVIVPIPKVNAHVWKTAAQKAYKWYAVKPNLNIDLNLTNYELSEFSVKEDFWIVKNNTSRPLVIATMREYPMDTNLIRPHIPEKHKYLIDVYGIVLNFGIGEVDMSISREQLQYTEKTIKAIAKKFEKIHNTVEIAFMKAVTEKNDEFKYREQVVNFFEKVSSKHITNNLFAVHVKGKFNIKNDTDLYWFRSNRDVEEERVAIVENGKLIKNINPQSRSRYFNLKHLRLNSDYSQSKQKYVAILTCNIAHKDEVTVVLRDGLRDIYSRVKALSLKDPKRVYLILESRAFQKGYLKEIKGSKLDKAPRQKRVGPKNRYIKNIYKLDGKKFTRILEGSFPQTGMEVIFDVTSRLARENRISSYSYNDELQILQRHGYSYFFTVTGEADHGQKGKTFEEALKEIKVKLEATPEWQGYKKDGIVSSKIDHIKMNYHHLQTFLEYYGKNNSGNFWSFRNVKKIIEPSLSDLFEYLQKTNWQWISARAYQYDSKIREMKIIISLLKLGEDLPETQEAEQALQTLQNRYPMLKYITYSADINDVTGYFDTVDYKLGDL